MEVAGLNLAVDSSKVAQATAELRQMAPAATAAEKATQKLTAAGNAASAANENFSRRVQGAIKSLEFERAQLARSSDERERYAAVRRAGVADASAEGRAIMASVAALQQQRSAQQAAAESMKLAQQQAAGYAALARQRAAEEAAVAAQQANLLRQEQAQRDAMAAKQAAQEAQRRAAAAAIVADLNFERQQLTRTAAEQAKYAALRRAGVSASSAEGQAIAASVAALHAQRAAVESNSKAMINSQTAAKAGAAVYGSLKGTILSLAAAFSIDAIIGKVTTALREVADLGETADQIGITVEGLQALQFQAVQGGVGLDQLNTAVGKFSDNIGKAAEGDKAMIESLQRLGVKILDLKGNLLPTEDLLVQVAKKITAIDDPARKVAAAVEFFGKAGKQMIPMLAEMAKGFDSMQGQAKAAGAVISAEAIAKLDALADSAAKSHLVMRAFFAENAAGPLTTMLDTITGMVGKLSAALIGARSNLTTLLLLAANPTTALAPFIASTLGNTPSEDIAKKIAAQRSMIEQGKIDLAKNPRGAAVIGAEIAKAQATLAALERQQGVMAVGGKTQGAFGDPDNIGIRVAPGAPKGVLDPTPKATGGSKSDPYKSAMESSRDYIASKNAETAAVGMSVEAAARLKHETELVNKATNDNSALTAAQTAQLKAQAAAMAEADTNLASAKFMDDFKTKSEEFIAAQQIEQDTLFMSTEAAMAYRLEHEALNQARAQGITLQAADIEKLREGAAAQAAAAAKTSQMTELANLGREAFEGFFSDLANGLRNGQSAWDAFGNAATSALNRIADTLIQMAAKKLFESAFSGGSGGGGGFLSGIFGSIQGWLTGGMANAGQPGSPYYGPVAPSAYGAAFAGGNVIPFARGGVVGRPTLFPMANGMGLMGEAGPEAVMPLRRGPGGRLGVEASGGGGGAVVVNIHNYAEGSKATAKQSKGPGGEMQIDVIVEMVEGKMAGRMARGQGSLGRVIEGTYGVQRQGR